MSVSSFPTSLYIPKFIEIFMFVSCDVRDEIVLFKREDNF